MKIIIGGKIRALRQAQGQSQEVVANACGVTIQAVAQWESDATKPTYDNLLALARHFSVTLDALVPITDESREPGREAA